MPQSRKRHGHTYHKPAAVPAKQRTKGRIVFALLFGAFGLVIALFAFNNYAAMIAGIVIGAIIGYLIGKQMEQNAKA